MPTKKDQLEKLEKQYIEYGSYAEDFIDDAINEKDTELFKLKARKATMSYLISVFMEMGYQPKESLEDFEKWFNKRISKYTITLKQFIYVTDSFEEYNTEEEKSIKAIQKKSFNFKTRFFNSYKMKNYLKEEYQEPNPINI